MNVLWSKIENMENRRIGLTFFNKHTKGHSFFLSKWIFEKHLEEIETVVSYISIIYSYDEPYN